MREEVTGQRFYSREGLWWSGRKIKWSQRDRCTGLRDIDDKWLHEGDIIRFAAGAWWARRREWLILCDKEHGWSAVRNGLLGQAHVLEEPQMQLQAWRWSGFGWNRPV